MITDSEIEAAARAFLLAIGKKYKGTAALIGSSHPLARQAVEAARTILGAAAYARSHQEALKPEGFENLDPETRQVYEAIKRAASGHVP